VIIGNGSFIADNCIFEKNGPLSAIEVLVSSVFTAINCVFSNNTSIRAEQCWF